MGEKQFQKNNKKIKILTLICYKVYMLIIFHLDNSRLHKLILMNQSVQSNQQYIYQMSERQSEILSDRNEKMQKPQNLEKQPEKKPEKLKTQEKLPKEDNPEVTIDTNISSQKKEQLAPSKILIKQKDRYQNKTIERNMFSNLEQSVDELKVVYSSSDLKKQQSTQSMKRRRPLKLSPLQNSSGVKLISQQQLNQNSKNYLSSSKVSLKPINVTPIRVKQIQSQFQFVKQSLPVHKKFIGILKRNRAGSKRLFPQYDLFMNQQVKFIMNSKRKPWHLTSTYHMGTHQQPVNQTDRTYVSTLKSNFSGSEFTLFYNSTSEEESQMLATIIYSNQISCQQVPRSLQVYILSPFFKYDDLAGADKNMNLTLKDLYELGENQQNKKIIKLINKKPTWDARKQLWCMDFHGKALYSSVKNMILQDAQSGKQCMIIAKAGQDVFNIEISFPLSPRIAMGIISSSFDFKWVSQ